MRHLYLLTAFILIATILHAQDSSIVLGRYERYLTTPGKLLKTNKTMVGEIRSVSIEVLKTTDIRKADSISVVRLTSQRYGNTSLISNNNFYIEKEELATVINLLQYYAAELKNLNAGKQVFYSYITENDVEISCMYEESFFSGWYVSFGKVYQHLRTKVPGSVSFSRRELETLIRLLQLTQQEL